MPEQHQLEFICRQCPLERCNEESLWCAYRWATRPNRQQKRMMRVAEGPPDRTQYYRDYYQANRDKKLAAANQRNRDAQDAKPTYHGPPD